MNFTNAQVAQLLRSVSAAYQIKGANRFQIAAYENAATAIENATSEVKDLWEQKNLNEIPGIGEQLEAHLEELFTKGHVRHFDTVMRGVPQEVFPLLQIPGVGPKTALKLAESGVTSVSDLHSRIEHGILASHGWSEKALEAIKHGIASLAKREDRMLLPYATQLSRQVLEYLTKCPYASNVQVAGSLRRRLSTVGDIDLAACSNDPGPVIEHFVKYPHAVYTVEKGDLRATIELTNGRRIDLVVTKPHTFGALLQHLTGSKQHNIHLRTLAQKRGYSLSEHGIKRIRSGKTISCESEDTFYRRLSMQTPPPELREDAGEIEAALEHKLPDLVRRSDILGDLHLHTTWSDGENTVAEVIRACEQLGYEYIAITDHAYPSLDFKDRKAEIKTEARLAKLKVLVGLEVNIAVDSRLQVGDDVLAETDFVIAAIHTGFKQEKDAITKRICAALAHPKVAIIAHPTGRILLEREGYEAAWDAVFEACVRHNKILEINAYPNRLDLPDSLVRDGIAKGVQFVINTDSHNLTHLSNMEYGVSVARRGWAERKDILNTLSYQDLCDRLTIRR